MPISFVIVGAPRTGSTLLVKTLNSLPGVCCHGELLGSQNVRGYEDGFDLVNASKSEREERLQRLLLERDSDPVGFMQRALSSDNTACGFKALYSAFLKPQWNDARTWLLALPDIRFIHLTRKNTLRRFVSEQIFLNGGPNHSGAGGRSETPIKIHIDIGAFETRSAEIELSTHTASTLARVCQFLALDDAPPNIEPALKKVGAAHLKDSVSNFQELRDNKATRDLALMD